MPRRHNPLKHSIPSQAHRRGGRVKGKKNRVEPQKCRCGDVMEGDEVEVGGSCYPCMAEFCEEER